MLTFPPLIINFCKNKVVETVYVSLGFLCAHRKGVGGGGLITLDEIDITNLNRLGTPHDSRFGALSFFFFSFDLATVPR